MKSGLDFEEFGGRIFGIMSTVVEIEEAIERLPFEQQREVAEWMDLRQFRTAAADMIFQMYDEEEAKGNAA